MIERNVHVVRPLPHQIAILEDDHRFKIVCKGRRAGGTIGSLPAALDGHGALLNGIPRFRGALHGATIWWVTKDIPTANEVVWPALLDSLARWGGADLAIRGQQHYIEFPGGGSITVVSAHKPQSLRRGQMLDGLIGDEAAFWPEEAWGSMLRPSLVDREGWAQLVSSPNGMNWFYREWDVGDRKLDPDYRSWRFPTSANPTIKPDELRKWEGRVGPFQFRRECLAEFEIATGSMFQRDWFRGYEVEGNYFVEPDGRRVARDALVGFVTCDAGLTTQSYSDFTVVMSWGWDRTTGHLYALDFYRGKVEVERIVGILAGFCTPLGDVTRVPVVLESIGPLVHLNAEARRAGLNVQELKRAARGDKIEWNAPGAAAVQAGRLLLPLKASWWSDVVNECCAFPDPHSKDDVVDCVGNAARFGQPIALVPAREKTAVVTTDPEVYDERDDRDLGGTSSTRIRTTY